MTNGESFYTRFSQHWDRLDIPLNERRGWRVTPWAELMPSVRAAYNSAICEMIRELAVEQVTPPAPPPPVWTDCKERLPGIAEVVLIVVVPDDPHRAPAWAGDVWLGWRRFGDRWMTVEGHEVKVSHWARRPALPFPLNLATVAAVSEQQIIK